MEFNKGDAIFTRLIEDNIYNIKDNNKVEFRRKATDLARKTKEEAILFFSKAYSINEFHEMQQELENVGVRDVKLKNTQDFIQKWRFYKRQFYSDFKKLYNLYKQ